MNDPDVAGSRKWDTRRQQEVCSGDAAASEAPGGDEIFGFLGRKCVMQLSGGISMWRMATSLLEVPLRLLLGLKCKSKADLRRFFRALKWLKKWLCTLAEWFIKQTNRCYLKAGGSPDPGMPETLSILEAGLVSFLEVSKEELKVMTFALQK